jgi:hypothetical protein
VGRERDSEIAWIELELSSTPALEKADILAPLTVWRQAMSNATWS